MNPARIIASRNHAAAIRVLKAAEMGSDLGAWQAADAAASVTRMALVNAEMLYPTKSELNRERREIEMSNRGLRK